MKKVIIWYLNLDKNLRLLLSSSLAAVMLYWSAFLSMWIEKVIDAKSYNVILLHFVFVVMLMTILYYISKYVVWVKEEVDGEAMRFKDGMLHSYMVCDRVINKNMSSIECLKKKPDLYLRYLMGSINNIKDIVEQLYYYFESQYSGVLTGDEINFEVTFMTLSYEDGCLTIPAYYNKNGRAPHSMLMRESDKDIYKNTVTAQMYRDTLVLPVIVEDTENDVYNYKEVYVDQKKRIKSSIVYPVLSDKNILLGTLVVHCDRKKFFCEKDRNEWVKTLEIYARKIAFEKVKLDVKSSEYNNGLEVKIDYSIPF